MIPPLWRNHAATRNDVLIIEIYEIGHISPSRLSRFLSTERSFRTYVVPSLTSVNVGFPASISLNAFSRFSRAIRSLTASLIYLLIFSVLCLRYSIMDLQEGGCDKTQQ